MTNQELMRRIRLGEDSALELKRIALQGKKVTGPGKKDFADELAAFANARGGTIVLGVDDKTRKVLGIPLDDLDAVEDWVLGICNDSVEPALDADIYRLELDGADGQPLPVIRVDVPRSLFVHKSPRGYFRWLGSSKHEMPPDVLARQFQERTQSRMIRFDESPVPHTEPANLDYELTRRFLRDEFVEEEGVTGDAARRLRLVVDDDDGTARLTLSAVLLCTREPQRWLASRLYTSGQLRRRTHRRGLPDGRPRHRRTARRAGRRGAALRTQKYAGARNKGDSTNRAPAIQRARSVRGAGQCGGP